MACLASLREFAGHMVRVRRTLEILQMATDARGGLQAVVVVDVTVGALTRWHSMHAAQNKPGRGVVELAVAPLRRVMALLAGRGKTCVRDRSGCTGEIFLVTRDTKGAGEVVIVVDVAVGALSWRHGVPAGQGKPNRGVIELGIQPVVRQVARFTGGGKLRGDVVRIGALLEIRRVTGNALRRHRLKLTVGCAFVTGVAVDGRMRPRQRKAVVVLLNLLDRNLPSPDGVTLLAIGSQLPLVNVGVTVLASLSDIAEYRLDVTLDAGY